VSTFFYTSGFLYNNETQQILLQQPISTNNPKLYLFGNKCHGKKDPHTVFRNHIEKTLGMTIKESSVHPVYDYVHDTLGEYFVFFIETSEVSPDTHPTNNKIGWFPLSKLSKLAMDEQTRHDIIVAERVIRARTQPAHIHVP